MRFFPFLPLPSNTENTGTRNIFLIHTSIFYLFHQLIGDEPVTDPTNIQSKHQKHQAFEAELNANNERLQHLLQSGENLIDANQCAGNDEAVKVCVLNCQICNGQLSCLKWSTVMLKWSTVMFEMVNCHVDSAQL